MMSMEFNDVLKQGYVKLKRQNVAVWKKKWLILRKASSKGPYRLEKYVDEKSSVLNYQKRQNKFIDLTDVTKFTRVSTDMKKHGVAMYMQEGGNTRLIALESEYEANEWLRILQEESTKHRASSRNGSISSNESPLPLISKDRFNVYLLPSISASFYGECVMHVTSRDLVLYDALDVPRKVLSWPLISIRRYGKDKTKFTFESGRHCDTGEGLFIFNTKEAEVIHRQVQVATVAIHEGQGIRRRQMLMESSSLDRSQSATQHTPSSTSNQQLQHSLSDPGLPPVTPDRAPCPLPRNHAPAPVPSTGTRSRPLPKLPPQEEDNVEQDDSFDDSSFENEDDMTDLLNNGKDLEPEFRRFINSRIGDHGPRGN